MIVNRRELKYTVSEVDYNQYVNLFEKVLTPDKSSADGSYRVRSLYFDSLDNNDYYDKMHGEEVRKKIRLRIYKTTDLTVKLEIKRKINNSQRKETISISREDAKALINKQYSVLLNYPQETAQTIYNIMTMHQYRPVVLVDYNRRAYMHPENNIRVTLDSAIRASETSFDIFDDTILMTPVFLDFQTILEVKFNEELFCWISEVIKGKDTLQQSMSKYCLSRQLFERYLA